MKLYDVNTMIPFLDPMQKKISNDTKHFPKTLMRLCEISLLCCLVIEMKTLR